jgi:hypothetical protein
MNGGGSKDGYPMTQLGFSLHDDVDAVVRTMKKGE